MGRGCSFVLGKAAGTEQGMSAAQFRQRCLEDAPRDTQVAPARSSAQENGDRGSNPSRVRAGLGESSWP